MKQTKGNGQGGGGGGSGLEKGLKGSNWKLSTIGI